MAGPVRIAILANAAQAKRELGSVESRASRMGSALKTAAVGGLLVAGAAAVKFGADSVKAASSAEQSIGATEQIYGRFADTVIKRSESAAKAVGISADEYRQLNNVLGATLSAAGMPLSKTADLTDKLTTRAADLAATFGGTTKDAIEAVSSLLRGEADPIERYGVSIKQSDVNARLAAKGLDQLEGSALKAAEQQARLDLLFQQSSKSAGQFGRESDTIAGKTQRLGARFEDVKARVGTLLLPVLVDLADVAERRVVPAIESAVGWLEDNRGEIGATATAIGDSLLPPLKALGSIAQDVVGFVAGLPEPIRSVGIQAAAAALILPRLNTAATLLGSGLTAARTNTTGLVTALKAGEGRMVALRGAAGGLAGTAGLLGLVASTQIADGALSTVASTASGALLGFSVGGPIGAAVGGLAGAFLGLSRNVGRATESADATQGRWQDYAATLDGVTGSVTQATKALALQKLQEDDALGSLNALGISNRTAVDAILGRAGASRTVSGVLASEQQAVDRLRAANERQAIALTERGNAGEIVSQQESDALAASQREVTERQRAINVVGEQTRTTREAIQAKREEIAATADYAGKLKGLPRAVRTEVRTNGIQPTTRAIATLSKRYGLTPRQVRTLIRATGVDASVRDVRKVQRTLRSVERVRPNLRLFTGGILAGVRLGERTADRGAVEVSRSLSRGTRSAKPDLNPFTRLLVTNTRGFSRTSQRGGQDIAQGLRRGTSGARADLGPFGSSLSSGVSGVRGNASSGGISIGNALSSGIQIGFSGTASALASSAASAVSQAVAAARRAAQSRSPSRKFMRVGREMGDGQVIGYRKAAKKGVSEARRLALALIAAAGSGTSDLARKIEAHGKSHKKSGEAIKRTIAITKKMRAALAENARAQQKSSDRLRDERTRLNELIGARKEYAATIRGSITSYASVTSVEEGHLNSTESFLAGLRERAAEATRFAETVEALRKRGLNATSLRQILDAGPEAGRAAADAIAAGGKAAVDEVNSLTKTIGGVGTTLGETMASQFHDAGIKAQEALLRGLERRDANLDRAANRIATNIVKAVRKSLGVSGQVNLPVRAIPAPKPDRNRRAQLRAAETYTRSQPVKVEATVRLTAQQISRAQRGEQIVLDVKAFEKAGGRA